MLVGNGQTALFWEDRWIDGRAISEIAPQLYACIPKRRRKTRTVAEGLNANAWARDIHGVVGIHEIGQYLCLWQRVGSTVLTQEPDHLIWRWTEDSSYTAKSCYEAMFHGALLSQCWRLIWKTWAPPRVRFFHWLAAQNRCWTADRLARRGLQHHPRCLLCDQLPESLHHLFMECPFSRQIWHDTLSWLRLPCAPPRDEHSLLDWWLAVHQSLPKPMRKGFATITLLTPWMIWKHRNSCVFDHVQPSRQLLSASIREEAELWVRAGAKGLRVLLPTTWDVH